MTQVKCKVKPCYYWKDGDVCAADSIMVDYNSQKASTTRMDAGDMDFDVSRARGRASGFADFEASDLTGSLGGTKTNKGDDSKAKSSEETLCSTFRPKNSEPRH